MTDLFDAFEKAVASLDILLCTSWMDHVTLSSCTPTRIAIDTPPLLCSYIPRKLQLSLIRKIYLSSSQLLLYIKVSFKISNSRHPGNRRREVRDLAQRGTGYIFSRTLRYRLQSAAGRLAATGRGASSGSITTAGKYNTANDRFEHLSHCRS